MFIPSEVVSQCNSRLYELPEGKGMAQAILGVDVARFGNDETVIYRNFKGHLKLVRKRHGQNLMATVGDIVKEYKGRRSNRPAQGSETGAEIEMAVYYSD